MTQYLFVYGTMLPGCAPALVAHLAARLRPVGEGFVRGTLYDLGRYPGAIPDASSASRIFGTVMALPQNENFLRELDEYEGFDPQRLEANEFVRELQTVGLSDGRTVKCWFYRYNLPANAAKIIEDGSWRGDRARSALKADR
jgi:gamma-glutamylcyclotransferase (GGCT)/AIG2-like uncharacterized protein YtfP